MDQPGLIAAQIPLERELEERAAFFVRLRWVAASGILVGAWLSVQVLGAGFSPWPLVITGGAVLVYNTIFFLWPPLDSGRDARSSRRIYAQMSLDWIALTCVVHYTGGVQSPAAMGHIFHVIIGALLLPRLASWAQAAIASGLVGGLVLVEDLGWWIPVEVGDLGLWAHSTGSVSVLRWAVLTGLFFIVAFLTQSIAVTLRRKERDLVDTQVRVDRALSEMQALYELGQVANATLDLQQVLALIAESATSLMGAKGCSIGLLDESGLTLQDSVAYGLSDDYLTKGPVLVSRSAMVAQALAGEVVQVQDIAADDRLQYPERAHEEGIRAIICVALRCRDLPIGVIRVYSAMAKPFSPHQVSFLRNLANLAAVAIVSARTYAESEALSDERAWFARTTHHQLRAPLAVMHGLLDALQYAGPLTEKQTDLIERATRRVDELLDLVRDLLDLAYAQRPSMHLTPECVVLEEALAPVLEMLAERAEQKQIELTTQGLQGLRVAAESEDVRRIFANLLENGVKYTPSGGTVCVQARRQPGRVCVEICDSGMGVAPTEHERIFDGFFRSEAAKESGELGTGVGLSIVRRLLQRWQGTIELESELGQGSCFRFYLPSINGD
ncbi:MAG: HAMP domain-containing histidine kinase [Gemmatimonadetes bacterium]|nr:HAMP domain-containing histidine kinase [Gemmatimonadota bacterium]